MDERQKLQTKFSIWYFLGAILLLFLFLGGQPGMQDISPQTAALIDQDISDLIEAAQKKAIELLTENREALDKIAEQLQQHEVIIGEEVHRIANEMGTHVPR